MHLPRAVYFVWEILLLYLLCNHDKEIIDHIISKCMSAPIEKGGSFLLKLLKVVDRAQPDAIMHAREKLFNYKVDPEQFTKGTRRPSYLAY